MIETNHANFNRIVGNAVGIQYGSTVAPGNNATIDVENNWWGCNYGPGAGGTGCSGTANGTLVFAGNTGTLDANPWIVLGVTRLAEPDYSGRLTSNITADMTHNSDNARSFGHNVCSAGRSRVLGHGGQRGTAKRNDYERPGPDRPSLPLPPMTRPRRPPWIIRRSTAPIDVVAPDFTISDVTQAETNSGQTAFVFTVTKTGASAFGSTVDYQTQDGTATVADSDYVAKSGTLTFGPTDTSMTITVLVNGDTAFETNETFKVHLSNATAATISDADGTGTITNDDAAPVLTIDDVTKAEGNTGTTSFTFTVTKTGATEVNATVDYATVDGTATSPSDFTAIATTGLTFLPNETTKQITVFVNGDTTVEPDETFTVHLSNPSAATITDADGLGPSSMTTRMSASPFRLPRCRRRRREPRLTPLPAIPSPPETLQLTSRWEARATFGSDYTQTGAATFSTSTGTVKILAGQTTATVTIDPTTDNVAEPDETVTLTVTSGTGYNVGSPAAATGTIVNDDTSVTVTVSPASVNEDGAAKLVYTFTRNPLLTGPLTIDFSVSGTATFNTDYTVTGADSFSSSAGSVTFADGSNTATVTVDPTSDNVFENNETVILTVGSGAGYSAGAPGAATGTIANDDPAPTYDWRPDCPGRR